MVNNSNTITENEYLNLATEAQHKYNELNQKLLDKEKQIKEIKKELISCYGYVRILDNMYIQQAEQDETITLMIEVLREFLSQFTEENITF